MMCMYACLMAVAVVPYVINVVTDTRTVTVRTYSWP